MIHRLDTNELTDAKFLEAFASIPTSVTSLDLGNNDLGCKTSAELALAFASIPASVTSLDLEGNHLGRKAGAKLAQAFAFIPSSVTSIDLTDNNFNDEKLANLFLLLPVSITAVTIGKMTCHPADYLVEQLFPIGLREEYYYAPFPPDEFEPRFDIDEAMLIRLIGFFQNALTPMRALVCALLLDGKILSSLGKAEADNHQDFRDNRVLLAIVFYRKAACDSALKSCIECLFWHKKTTENSSVINRELSKYRLSPDSYASTYNAFKEGIQLAEKGGLLEVADDSAISFSNISDILRKRTMLSSLKSLLFSFSPCLIFGLWSSVVVGVLAVALLWLSVPALIALTGTIIIGTVGLAACRFFYNVRHDNVNNPEEPSPAPSQVS